MKTMTLALLITTSIILSGATPNEYTTDPLYTLTEIATANQLPITGWEVTTRETVEKSKMDDIVNDGRNSHLVAVSEDENSIKYNIVQAEKPTHVDVQQYMIIAKNNPDQVELIAVISGTEWHETIQEEYDITRDRLMETFFHRNPETFTCIELLDGDTIENRAVIDIYTESLALVHMEEQFDNLEMSRLKKQIYGYTPLWNEKLIVDSVPYNLQIAATELETGEMAYTIGTPILINEY